LNTRPLLPPNRACGSPAHGPPVGGSPQSGLKRYGFSEEIINYKRRWFVASDEATTILPNLLAQRKPVRDLTVVDAPDQVEQNGE